LLSHPLVSFPPGRGGGRARGAVWRVRVCDCNEGPLAEDHWVCTINNEGALKKNLCEKKLNSRGAKIRCDRRAEFTPRGERSRESKGSAGGEGAESFFFFGAGFSAGVFRGSRHL